MTPPPVNVELPVRLVIDPLAGARLEEVDHALGTVLDRALDAAQVHVPLSRTGPSAEGDPVAVTWTGPGVAQLPGDAKRQIEHRVRAIVADRARRRGIRSPSRPPATDPAAAGPFAPAAVALRRARAGRPAARLRPPIDYTETGVQLRSSSRGDRGFAALAIYDALSEGDWEAFLLGLWGIQPGDDYPTATILTAMRSLWARNPQRLRKHAEAAAALWQATFVRRTDRNVEVDAALLQGPAIYAAGLVRLQREIPALGLSAGWEGAAPGLDRLVARLRALSDSLVELLAHVRESDDAAPPEVLATLGLRTQDILNLAGVLAVQALSGDVAPLVADLDRDVAAFDRFVGESLDALRDLDAMLGLYRSLFREAAPEEEEVAGLLEARAAVLGLVLRYGLPDPRLLAEVEAKLTDATGGWRLRATVARIARLRDGVAKLRVRDQGLSESSPFFTRAGELPRPIGEAPWNDPRVPFLHRLRMTRDELAAAGTQLEELAAPGAAELAALLELEARLAALGVRQEILRVWMFTMDLQRGITESRVGDQADNMDWYARIAVTRTALEALYDKLDLEDPYPLQEQVFALERVRSDVNRVANYEALKGIGITIVALIVTKKLGGLTGGAGAGALRVTIADAAVFTVVSGIGRSIFLDRPIDPGETIGEFVDNAMLFAVHGILQELVTAGPLRALRGRPVAQLAVTLTASTIIGTGLQVVIARLQHPPVSGSSAGMGDQAASILLTNLIVTGLLTALTGPGAVRALERNNAVELAAELRLLKVDAIHAGAELRVAMDATAPGETAGFEAARSRALELLAAVQRQLGKLLALDERILAELGLDRGQLLTDGANLGELQRGLAAITYAGPRGAPPAPDAVPGTALVRRSPTTYEYPAGEQPETLVDTMRAAGYAARLEGGVVRLALRPGEPEILRLLPAAAAAAPTLSAAEREAQVLLLDAVGPARDKARDLLGEERGDAARLAAQLAPDLVREAITAPTADDEAAATGRLEARLRALRMSDQPMGFLTPGWVEQATSMIGALSSSRRAAVNEVDEARLLEAAGGGPAARDLLATADGGAVARAWSRAGEQIRLALAVDPDAAGIPEAVLTGTLQAHGIEPGPVLRGVHALRAGRIQGERTPDQVILDAAGHQEAITRLVTGSPWTPALRRAAAAHPDLVRRALRAEGSAELNRARGELLLRLEHDGVKPAEQDEVGVALAELNSVRLAQARGLPQEIVRVERARSLLDTAALAADANVVIQRFGAGRRARALPWLALRVSGADGQPSEAVLLNREVDASPPLQERLAHGGTTMLRQLWTMYRAGRWRPAKSTFPDYVTVLDRLNRGLHGEYQFAFWAGEEFILLKAPDSLVTVGGTDIIVIPRGGGRLAWVDQKALSDEQVSAVSALTVNMPQNLRSDLAELERIAGAGGDVPGELAMAIPRVREAVKAIDAIQGGRSKHQLTEADQVLIGRALARFEIDRVIANAGGSVKGLSPALERIAFLLWDVQGS